MDEKDLLIFLTLADTGNLTRTAEKLYLSQPTLSKRLQNMEADLGAALFLRSKQGVISQEVFLFLTEVGSHMFYVFVKILCYGCSSFVNAVQCSQQRCLIVE